MKRWFRLLRYLTAAIITHAQINAMHAANHATLNRGKVSYEYGNFRGMISALEHLDKGVGSLD